MRLFATAILSIAFGIIVGFCLGNAFQCHANGGLCPAGIERVNR
jgi:hypothetical protein